MNKLALYIIVGILLSFTVLGLPSMTQTNVKPTTSSSYNNLTIGDIFKTSASSTVEFKIDIKNVNSNNQSTSNITLKVEDLSIENTIPSFTLSNNEEITKYTSFYIPSGTADNRYRVRVYLNSMVNGTQYINSEINSYWMDVSKEVDIEKEFYKNLTDTCTKSIASSTALINMINYSYDYADRWGICLKTLGESETKAIAGDNYKNQSDKCKTEVEELRNTISIKDAQINNMVNKETCNSDITTAVNKKQNDLMTYGIVIIIIAALLYNNWWKKKGLAIGGGQGTPLHSA